MSKPQDQIIEIHPDFWNIRGSFRLMGLDIGTQASLVRRSSGGYVFLDSYSMPAEVLEAVLGLTDGGASVEAVINLHPFHTVHVAKMQTLFPNARHYGTARHVRKFPDLKWEKVTSEQLTESGEFADDLMFSVPEGVDFISDNQNVHFSSVLAYHPRSGTIHVDDTLVYTPLPKQLPLVGGKGMVGLHPTLMLALEKVPGAADAFIQWLNQLCEDWVGARNLCAAHSGVIRDDEGLIRRIQSALRLSSPLLAAHRFRYG